MLGVHFTIPPDDLEYLLKITISNDKFISLEICTVQEEDHQMATFIL